MAIEVARELRFLPEYAHVKMKGLALVNPATSYLRSSLYKLGPPIANNSSIIPPITFLLYIYSLTNQLVPLFLDEGRALQQLVLMLSSKALPAVLNTPQREAYLGRVAFDLVNRLKFMPQETLKWRLEEWLQRGCTLFESRLEKMQQQNDGREGLETLKRLQTLIVVGEIDLTLPSVEEAQRLSSTVFDSTKIHVVPEAGHASTCGGSLHLVQVMRDFFSCLDKVIPRAVMTCIIASPPLLPKGVLLIRSLRLIGPCSFTISNTPDFKAVTKHTYVASLKCLFFFN